MKECVLLHFPSMGGLADELMAEPVMSGGQVRRGSIKWSDFPDGFPNLFIENASQLAGKRVVILLSFHDKATLFEQISVIYTLPRLSVRSLTIVLSYFPTGTMERVDTIGQVATAKSLSRMLSSIPSASRGPPHVVIFDIHALQEQFYFADNILPHLLTATPLLMQEVEKFSDRESVSIAFPDEGAYKRFHRLLPSFPTITCMKVREGNQRKVTIVEGEAKGRHVIIVDDLVQSGGTLMECKNELIARGAGRVSCFVPHAVFPNGSWKRFAEEEAATRFANFFVTNSCPEVTSLLQGEPPFHVLSLAPLIAGFLKHNL